MSEKTMFKSFSSKFEADVIASTLDNAGIANWFLNKQDSAYGSFGRIEIYIEIENLQKANTLISAQGQ